MYINLSHSYPIRVIFISSRVPAGEVYVRITIIKSHLHSKAHKSSVNFEHNSSAMVIVEKVDERLLNPTGITTFR